LEGPRIGYRGPKWSNEKWARASAKGKSRFANAREGERNLKYNYVRG